MEDNLTATQVKLSDDDLRTLALASVRSPEYPGWILAMGGARQKLLETGALPEQH